MTHGVQAAIWIQGTAGGPSTRPSGITENILQLLGRLVQAHSLNACRSLAGLLRSIYLTDAFLCQGTCHHGEHAPMQCIPPRQLHAAAFGHDLGSSFTHLQGRSPGATCAC